MNRVITGGSVTVYALIPGSCWFFQKTVNITHFYGEWRRNWTSKGSEDVPDHHFTPAKTSGIFPLMEFCGLWEISAHIERADCLHALENLILEATSCKCDLELIQQLSLNWMKGIKHLELLGPFLRPPETSS